MSFGDPGFDRLFKPRSIAVAGASNKTGKMGALFMQRLATGFRGALYAINPGEAEVAGVPACRSPAELPAPVDLLIALVPAARMVELVEGCAPGQVGHLLAIPSGVGEVAGEGPELQSRLAAAARARGMRVVGPNCAGLLNCVTGLNASLMPALPPGGRGLGCLTQSGGFGMALSMYALDHDLTVSKFLDLGNTVDIDVLELLAFLRDDPETVVIALFLEAVRELGRFRELLAEVGVGKPVLLTGVGRTAAGRRASVAHLGLAPNLAELPAALPPGVIRCETGLELLQTAKALAWQLPGAGRRVGIVTGTGGIAAELADLAAEHGLEVREFSPALQAVLRDHLPSYASVRNPVDLTPIWWEYPDVYPRVLEELFRSGEVDAVAVSITDVAATLPALAEAVAGCCTGTPIPVCVYWGARDEDRARMRIIEAARIPCYRSTRETMCALRALAAPSSDALPTP